MISQNENVIGRHGPDLKSTCEFKHALNDTAISTHEQDLKPTREFTHAPNDHVISRELDVAAIVAA